MDMERAECSLCHKIFKNKYSLSTHMHRQHHEYLHQQSATIQAPTNINNNNYNIQPSTSQVRNFDIQSEANCDQLASVEASVPCVRNDTQDGNSTGSHDFDTLPVIFTMR